MYFLDLNHLFSPWKLKFKDLTKLVELFEYNFPCFWSQFWYHFHSWESWNIWIVLFFLFAILSFFSDRVPKVFFLRNFSLNFFLKSLGLENSHNHQIFWKVKEKCLKTKNWKIYLLNSLSDKIPQNISDYSQLNWFSSQEKEGRKIYLYLLFYEIGF